MRLFFALTLPQEVIACLAKIQRDMRQAIPDIHSLSVPAPANMHLTLEFLGEIPPDRLPDLSAAAQQAVARCTPFDAQLQGAGAFPSLERAAVLWCGVGSGREAIIDLQASLRRALQARRVKTERRRYQPHVTLARVRKPVSAEIIGRTLAHCVPSPVWQVKEIELIESQLLPSGARYTRLERFPLCAPGASDVE